MNLIVAVDSNWAIGKENKLLVSIPQDMKFFRETTKGKVVAMGRIKKIQFGRCLRDRWREYLPPTSSVLYKGLCYKDRSCI